MAVKSSSQLSSADISVSQRREVSDQFMLFLMLMCYAIPINRQILILYKHLHLGNFAIFLSQEYLCQNSYTF